jgi:alkylation response protein AidB-like acyl-CoA dehydrogenase
MVGIPRLPIHRPISRPSTLPHNPPLRPKSDVLQLQTQLGGVTALAKAQGGIIFEFCASTAVNLFGGLGLTKGGQGERVERLWRDCKIAAIPGGSEEVLLDLAIRQQVKIQRKKGAKI